MSIFTSGHDSSRFFGCPRLRCVARGATVPIVCDPITGGLDAPWLYLCLIRDDVITLEFHRYAVESQSDDESVVFPAFVFVVVTCSRC